MLLLGILAVHLVVDVQDQCHATYAVPQAVQNAQGDVLWLYNAFSWAIVCVLQKGSRKLTFIAAISGGQTLVPDRGHYEMDMQAYETCLAARERIKMWQWVFE